MNLPDHYPKRPSTVMGESNDYSAVNTDGNPDANADFLQSYEYVLVFPMAKDFTSETKEARYCMNEMLAAGLEIFPYKSIQDDELLVLVRAPNAKLRQFADKIDYKMKVNSDALQKLIEAGNPERRIKPVKITHDSTICKYYPYDHIYLKYEQDIHFLYERRGEDGLGTDPFIKSVRLKLLFEILRAPKHQGGCSIELNKLLHKKKILAMFPLHDHAMLSKIREKCMDRWTMPWDVPILDIKEYFGEKLALYNVFLGHYSSWLVTPSIIGLAFQLVVWATLDFSHPVLPFYSLVITVWSVFMLEFWKRHESATAMRWGTADYEQSEQDRPEYTGETMISFIDGRKMTYNSLKVSRRILTMTQSVVCAFIAMVIGVVAGIYVFRFYLQRQNDGSGDYASTVASVLNTVQIVVFNTIYQWVANRLTDIENHRTDTAYEDSLIVKLFVFQFINSYASFFFLAFIAGNLARPDEVDSDFQGQCGATNCMQPLSINLAIIFGTRLTFSNLMDILIPYVSHLQRKKKESKGVDEARLAMITPAEQEYYLQQFRPMVEGIQNYADMAVQYGFTLLFITALPCASFFSLVSNYVKVKLNCYKLSELYQRPIPRGAQDIGTWQTILAIISVASVVTNAGLICFTMDVLWRFSLQGRVWIFVGFQWVLIFLQFLVQAAIPDVPEGVTIQNQRTTFFHEKIISKVEDEDFGDNDEAEEAGDEDTGLAAQLLDVRGACCGLKTSSHHIRRIPETPAIPAMNYPRNQQGGEWPKPYTTNSGHGDGREDSPLPAHAAAGGGGGAPSPTVATASYESAYAALPPRPPADNII